MNRTSTQLTKVVQIIVLNEVWQRRRRLLLAVVVIATIQEEPCGKGHQHGRQDAGVVSSTLAGRSTVAAVAHMEYHRNETLGTVTTT